MKKSLLTTLFLSFYLLTFSQSKVTKNDYVIKCVVDSMKKILSMNSETALNIIKIDAVKQAKLDSIMKISDSKEYKSELMTKSTYEFRRNLADALSLDQLALFVNLETYFTEKMLTTLKSRK